MNVVPGLSRAAGFVHPGCAVLIKVPCVQREQATEQRVLGVVISADRDVNPAYKADKLPPSGPVPEVSIADDSLLMMSVERGDKLASEAHPAPLPPGDIRANHISFLQKCMLEVV